MSNMGQGSVSLRDCRRRCTPFRLHWARRLFAAVFALSFVSLFMAGCGGSGSSSNEPVVNVPDGTRPCEHPEYWPHSIASDKEYPGIPGSHRFRVYYRSQGELGMAREVVRLLDDAWDKEMNTIGFTPPLRYPPEGKSRCGQDASFAVFLWDGHRSCFVAPVDPEEKDFLTPWGGLASYMILDAWGPYGIDRNNLINPRNQLRQTIGHELNHASHAADDFHDIGIAYEMSATFIEQLYGPSDPDLVADFQSKPEWSLLWYEYYGTWYLYGSALYMNFLRDKYFYEAGRTNDLENDRFLADLWRAVRNTPDPKVNSPNWVDGINAILAPKNSSFIESLEVFARWRYYAGDRDDGKHFRPWQLDWTMDRPSKEQMPFQKAATLKIPSIVMADDKFVFDGPMVLGNVYLEVARAEEEQTSFGLTLPDPITPGSRNYKGIAARWMVQALPGIVSGSDG
ncbi:MAG TPA: hypothetical protein VN328_07970, partial [Thermodesulfovibrionales bacterium]|nr:hypothetical protein [Thermodesulfovibrionales bacterium]